MHMTRTVCAAGLVFALAATAGQQAIQRERVPESGIGVKMTRLINTAEAEYFITSGEYVALPILLAHPKVKGLGFVSRPTDPSEASTADYKLSLVVSKDGQHYHISLEPATDCGVAVFTSERGVIYQGRSLGCGKP